jgi:hypothetical protein
VYLHNHPAMMGTTIKLSAEKAIEYGIDYVDDDEDEFEQE